VSARRDGNGGRPQWVQALRRAGQEVMAARRLCDHGMLAVDGFLQSNAERFVPTVQLLRVPRGLQIAMARLDRAARRLDMMLELAALDPGCAAEAGLLVVEVRERWLAAADFLMVVAIQTCSVLLVIESHTPGPWIDALHAAAADALAFPAVDLSLFDHSFLRPDGSAERERLRLLGRRRSAPRRVADAPRRISRGRAPPVESTCQL